MTKTEKDYLAGRLKGLVKEKVNTLTQEGLKPVPTRGAQVLALLKGSKRMSDADLGKHVRKVLLDSLPSEVEKRNLGYDDVKISSLLPIPKEVLGTEAHNKEVKKKADALRLKCLKLIEPTVDKIYCGEGSSDCIKEVEEILAKTK